MCGWVMDGQTDKLTKRKIAETRQAERKIQGNRRDRRYEVAVRQDRHNRQSADECRNGWMSGMD
jgi:hypothetical protein